MPHTATDRRSFKADQAVQPDLQSQLTSLETVGRHTNSSDSTRPYQLSSRLPHREMGILDDGGSRVAALSMRAAGERIMYLDDN
ncbi:hypothetical protein IFM47457_00207 [Aspergillus lentulus]|nr:hypothetical protein IFM47457_00207 [Aspergillus lentulus]